MTISLLLAFAVFAFVSAVTPGPNNAMLMSSGVRFGMRRSIPHMLGVSLGFPVMILLIGFGLGAIFNKYPVLYTALRYICMVYLLVLAWKIASADKVEGGRSSSQPMTFVEAILFQWINPKAWVMALSTIAAYVPREHFFTSILVVDLVFACICFPCVLIWTGFGHGLRGFLSHPKSARIFNISMALLLVASLVPIFRETAGK